MQQAGFSPQQRNVERFGCGDGVPQPRSAGTAHHPPEVMLRLAVRDARKEAVEYFAQQFAPLITSGPAGLAGYATGRPQVQRAYGHWPTLVPRQLVRPEVEVHSAAEWVSREY
jgi:hypothetical protein